MNSSRRLNTIAAHLLDVEDIGSRSVCSSSKSTSIATSSNSTSGGCKGCDEDVASTTTLVVSGIVMPGRVQSVPSVIKEPKIVSGADYVASLYGRGLKVFYLGSLIAEPSEHPAIRPSVNAVAETYEIGVREPALGRTISSISGFRVSRFLHITASVDDVVMQSRMQRKLGQLTGTCFQRCVGMDALNALFSVTFDVDQKYKTTFHDNLLRFLRKMHELNAVVGGAMTDGKGDRSKRPSEQQDLDVHVRVVERRVDGIILRGVKTHQTGCVNSHYIVVMPGGALQANEKEFAIACSLPVTATGITYIIGRQSCDLRSLEANADIDLGNATYGGQEAVIIFDNVFVPYEDIFLDGQTEFCGSLVERFTAYHRRSYICKAGLGDVLVGAAATVAEYNGASKASHVKDKIIEMVHLNETLASCALAASFSSTRTVAGNWIPDILMANVCKHNVTRHPYEISRLAQDLAGGLLVTLPSHLDFDNSETGPMLRKYLAGAGGEKNVDDRRRILRLIENMTLGRNAVGYLTESMHGAGSPQAQRVVIARLHDVDQKMRMAKRLAGISV